jgi:hypothetical protein
MASAMSQHTVTSIVQEDSWPCPSEIPPPNYDRQRQSVVHIDTPGCRITVRPEDIPPDPPPRPREIRGCGRRDIWDWVSQSPNLPVIPQVDRRGRTIKPKIRYDPEDEEQRHKELKQRAKQRLLDDSRKGRANANLQVQAQEIAPVENSRAGSQISSEDSTFRSQIEAIGTRSKTRSESEPVKMPASKKTEAKRPANSCSKKSGSGRSQTSKKT